MILKPTVHVIPTTPANYCCVILNADVADILAAIVVYKMMCDIKNAYSSQIQ